MTRPRQAALLKIVSPERHSISASRFQRRASVVQAPDDMVRLGVAVGEDIRAGARCPVPAGGRRARMSGDAAGHAAGCRLRILRGRDLC